jgi:hypothetical protein
MRAIAPIGVLSTVVVLASGVALLAIGPSSRGELLPVHKVAFIVWSGFFALHVLGHLAELPRALSIKRESEAMHARETIRAAWDGLPAGRSGRLLSLSGAVVGGVVLGIVFVPQFAPWLHEQHQLLVGGR